MANDMEEENIRAYRELAERAKMMPPIPLNLVSKHPPVGSLLIVPIEPHTLIVKIAHAIANGMAFPVDPELPDKEDQYNADAKLQLGTMLMNYKVDSGGEPLFAIRWREALKIDVFRWSQAMELQEALAELGKDDVMLKSVQVTTKKEGEP